MLSGLVVGWTVRTGIVEFLAGFGLLLLFAFAMSWIGVWLGLSVPTVEVAQQVVFTVLFPLTFLSNAFVPPQTLPDWLRPFAEWNPTSTLSAALRDLWGNPEPVRRRQLPVPEPDPRDAHLGRRDRAGVRVPRRPQVPLDEPLSAGQSSGAPRRASGSASHSAP